MRMESPRTSEAKLLPAARHGGNGKSCPASGMQETRIAMSCRNSTFKKDFIYFPLSLIAGLQKENIMQAIGRFQTLVVVAMLLPWLWVQGDVQTQKAATNLNITKIAKISRSKGIWNSKAISTS